MPGHDFNVAGDLTEFVLAVRHEGATLDPPSEFPLFVFITRPLIGLDDVDEIDSASLEVVGWGELYPTREDARSHRFD